MRTLFYLILLLALVFQPVAADSFDKVGTTAAQFLRLNVGARADGMGGAFVAIADDPTAAYWNPAGLTHGNGLRTLFNHQQWFIDVSHDFVAIQAPLSRSIYGGIAVSALTMDEQEVRTVANPDGTGLTYSVMDIAVTGSLARRMSDRLSYGLSVKYIQSAAYNEKASTFALDIGSQLKTGFSGLVIGMALSNFGGEMRYEGVDLIAKSDIDNQFSGNVESDVDLRTESWPLPLMIRIGLALDLMGKNDAFFISETQQIKLALDAEHPNDSREHVNLGVEYGLWERFYLRAGYRLNYDIDSITLGAGLLLPVPALGQLGVQYSVHPMGPFGSTSQLTLVLNMQ